VAMSSSKWSRCFSVLAALCCICCALSTSAAQDSPSSEYENRVRASLTVTAALDENDKLTLRTYALGLEGGESIKPTLEAAFGCKLKDSWSRIALAAGYSGHCQVSTSARGLLREYRFSTQPLRQYAVRNKLEVISAILTLPGTEIRETVPATKDFQISRQPAIGNSRKHSDAVHTFAWATNSAMPELVTIRFGYDSSGAGVARRFGLPLGAFCLPVLLALWLRRRALASRFEDKASVWFSYIRYQQWLLNGSLLAWWASTESARLEGFLRFVLRASSANAPWLAEISSTLADWIPPAAVWVICMVVSQPVHEKLRGLNRTRKELALQAIYSLCSALLPLLLLIKGVAAAARLDFRSLVLYVIASFLVRVIAGGRLRKLLGMQPQALSIGELRDAAFQMAHRLGVKLQQIYVIPAGKSQMANAFARSGNTIAFTDYLLERMTRREVNYILGHELTHLRLRHLRKLSTAIVGCVVFCIVAQEWLGVFLPGSAFFRYAAFFVVVTTGTYFWSRRFEFEADAGAVESTGDAPAAISALFKLASLNLHPLQWSKWSEKWLTHPSTLRRAQAIARRAGIPFERLAEIAQTAVSEDAHYAIPASAMSGNKLHSSTQKASDVRRIAFGVLGARLLIPAGFALIVKFVPMSPSSDRLVYFLGAIATFTAVLLLINFVSARRFALLVPQLKSKFEKEGIQVEGWSGTPVSLAPGALPRSYEGHMHWDLGFLFLEGDRICYWGEETRFALRREQISEIKLGFGAPHLFRMRRVYIAWRDLERSTCGVFSLGSAEPGTLLAVRRRTRELFIRLLKWHKETASSHALAQPLESLTTPDFRNVTGASPLRLRKPIGVIRELYRTAFFAAGVALVAGLPFHIVDFMADAQGFASRPHAPGSGWYVVLVAVTIRLIQYVPIFRYKEVPVVQASLPGAPARRETAGGAERPEPQPEPAIR
jgi:Zn-dependent protease with chaperone function